MKSVLMSKNGKFERFGSCEFYSDFCREMCGRACYTFVSVAQAFVA